MRTLVSLLAIAALSAPAFAQDAPAGPNAIQVLDDCVSAHALQLEISHEAADVVAQAAVASCARELTAASQGMGGLRSTSSARDELKNSMRESALVQIVELRAARNTPKPPPPPPEKPPARVKKKLP